MKREKFQIKLSSGFVLLIASIYFFDTEGTILSLAPAIFFHELGHALAIKLVGGNIIKLKADISGFSLDYHSQASYTNEMFCAISGPILGLAYSIFALLIGNYYSINFFIKSSGLGFIINFVNLLPILPLDGGVFVEKLFLLLRGEAFAQKVLNILSVILISMLILLGSLAFVHGFGAALLIFSILLFCLRPCN